MGKKATNTIELKNFQNWLTKREIEYDYSRRERKRIVVQFDGNIIISVAGKIVWHGYDAAEAVEAYNAITEKYKDEKPDFTL